MRILVTGANGYIGSNVVKRLLDMGHHVIANDIDNRFIDKRAEYINADIFNDHDFYNIFKRPDICLHLAWRDGFIHNSDKHMYDLSLHYNFISKMVEAGIKHIAIMGSMHEIGYFEGKIDENTPTNPLSYYGIAKDALRRAVEILCDNNNVLFQWMRGFYIFGDDSHGNSIFCKIRKSVQEGKKTFPFTSGKNKFDFIHINDLCNQIAYTITQKSIFGIINVCSGNPISLAEQIEWYIKHNNLQIQLDYGKFPDRPYESPCIYGDSTKINIIMKQKRNKILVTGVKGQLGFDCVNELRKRGYTDVYGIDIDDLDITNEDAVNGFIKSYKPDVVMHNAAWTAVDKAEENKQRVYEVNVLGTKYIAKVCSEIGAKMVYISTDYVFDGKGENCFEIDDKKNGLSVYGVTKSEGEDWVIKLMDKYFIVRTSWVFGSNGRNFVKTMLNLASTGRKEINVVCDQIGSVTYTRDLAELLCDMIETEKYGVYHATNEGYLSWYEFACEIFKLSSLEMKVNPVTTDEYFKFVSNQAQRPLNSRMSKKSLVDNGFELLPNWKDALKRYLQDS